MRFAYFGCQPGKLAERPFGGECRAFLANGGFVTSPGKHHLFMTRNASSLAYWESLSPPLSPFERLDRGRTKRTAILAVQSQKVLVSNGRHSICLNSPARSICSAQRSSQILQAACLQHRLNDRAKTHRATKGGSGSGTDP